MKIKISKIIPYKDQIDPFQIESINEYAKNLFNGEPPPIENVINVINDVSECVFLASKEMGIKAPQLIIPNGEREITVNFEGIELSRKREQDLVKTIRTNIHIYEISVNIEILAF